jgi:hypothetical protein
MNSKILKKNEKMCETPSDCTTLQALEPIHFFAKLSSWWLISRGLPDLEHSQSVSVPQQQQNKKSKKQDSNKVPLPAEEKKSNMASDKTAVEKLVLETLASSQTIPDSFAFAKNNALDHKVVVGVVFSLQSSEMVISKQEQIEQLELTPQGVDAEINGAPENRAWSSVPTEGISRAALMELLGDAGKFAYGQAMKQKWIAQKGDVVVRVADDVKDETKDVLTAIKNNPDPKSISDNVFKDLQRRKLVTKS